MDGTSDLQARAEGGVMNKGRRTANRILDAAEELFAQNGHGATSLRDIAAKVGLQQPALTSTSPARTISTARSTSAPSSR